MTDMIAYGNTQLDLQRLITGWNDTADAHKQALDEGWDIATQFVQLHDEALTEIASAVGASASTQDRSVILLGCHAFNLFTGCLGLVLRGQFDVASHLMRGLFDTQALLYGASREPELAEQFDEGTLKASFCRKLVIEHIRSGDAETAAYLDERWKNDYGAVNQLAHASVLHGDKLVVVDGETVTPMWGVGHTDTAQCRLFWKAVLEPEFWTLTWFAAFRQDHVSEAWIENFEAAKNLFGSWMKAEDS